MSDPVADAARTAGATLAAELGSGLPADVEAALYVRQVGDGRPSQYVDPVSLAGLIVAIATLAWTVYSDLRKRVPEPAQETVVRQVRMTLRDSGELLPPQAGRITEVVVTEVIKAVRADE